jgi:hypothetical protein
VGPPVTDSLANIVNAWFENELGQDKLKEKLKFYRRPSNCKKLKTPKVNLTIWKKMSTSTRSRDLRLGNIQTTIHAAVAAIVSMIPSLVKLDKTTGKTAFEALALIGHASRKLSRHRREDIAFSLGKGFSRLMTPSVPITDCLFGDDADLPKNLTEAKKLDQLGYDRPKNFQIPWKSRNRYQPYQKRFPYQGHYTGNKGSRHGSQLKIFCD